MNVEHEIIVGEFAQEKPGSDINVLFMTNNKLDKTKIQRYIAQSYMSLYATGGNNPKPKEGFFPVGEEETMYAFANPYKNGTRMLCLYINRKEIDNLNMVLINEHVKEALITTRIALSKETFDPVEIASLIKILSTRISEVSLEKVDLDRIADIFGKEL